MMSHRFIYTIHCRKKRVQNTVINVGIPRPKREVFLGERQNCSDRLFEQYNVSPAVQTLTETTEILQTVHMESLYFGRALTRNHDDQETTQIELLKK